MNDVEELKRFAAIHARAQHLRDYPQVLARIHTDDQDTPGSWVREWRRSGEALERDGRLLEACRYYNMARFPFVDGPARQEAQELCVRTFERWRERDEPGIQRLDVELPEGRIRCWADGLSAQHPRPLALIMGGIVSTKEHYGQVLVSLRKLGMASIATEMPGIGENTLNYTADRWTMFPALLDAVGDRARVAETYALTFSFSGHLALRWAGHDPRVRGIVAAGTPISEFFTDRDWQRRLPRITTDTLAHLTGMKFDDLRECLPAWRLTAPELAAVDVPVHYLASRRDEIIPVGELDYLRRHVRRLRVAENDDVHASPRHVAETRFWIALSVLQMRGGHAVQRAVLGTIWGALRARGRLSRRAP